MIRSLVYLVFVILLNVGSFAFPIHKRSGRDYRTRPVQGVEVNGLFNPMASLSPQLFERASEEQGSPVTTYHDICKLLPQEKLDVLMADHFATFVTHYDLEVLKSAHINTLRIPVSYNMFLPEANRTDSFPRGERNALDVFIERALHYDMNIWLDLMATPNNQLGTLEQYGNIVTPETARNVIKHIAKKYDARDVTTILVHPDVTFPSTPSNIPPLHPTSIKKTKNSHYNLYRELSSILDRKGHVLAIDTSHNLDWWRHIATSFSSPVVLVHSVKTGVLSTYQQSVTRLLTGIKEDIQDLKELAKDMPLSVTWDASINACVHSKDGPNDCTLRGQLWQAAEREPKRVENEETLNGYTERFGVEILRELEKINIATWFFRTAKIQASVQSDINDEPTKLIKRRRAEKIVSGNDFLAMYKYGMFPKPLLLHETKDHKSLFVPAAIGLGVASAGALGWQFWDDIRKIGSEFVQFVQNVQKPASIVEKPKSTDMKPPIEPVLDLLRTMPDEITCPPEITPPIAHEEPPAPSNGYIFPFAEFPGIKAESRDDRDDYQESIEPLDPYSRGLVIHYPFSYPSEGGPAWGIIDNTKNPPVEELIQKWEGLPEPSVVTKSDAVVEVELLNNRGSVAASIAKFETPQSSNAKSLIHQSRQSFRSTDSEFQLSEGISGKNSRYLLPLSDIQRDLEANRVLGEEWIHRISVGRPRRTRSGPQDADTKRHGKVLSVEEKELLDQMMSKGVRREQKEASFIKEMPKISRPPAVLLAKDQSQDEKEKTVEDTSIAAPAADLKPKNAADQPLLKNDFDPELLTHAQQEQYTRPHIGTGGGFPDSTPELAKLRRDTKRRQTRSESKLPMPKGHHIIGGEKARPMTVHAPRHKDMDPNHPHNLKKIKSKTDEYKPYPPPEAKHMIKTHHVETTKIVSRPKGILGIPSTITVYKKESKQLHPDIATALTSGGQEIPPSLKSGIGKDPRKAYEIAHWTKDEREGHLAYVDNVLNNPTKLEGGVGSAGRVGRLANIWIEKERMKSLKISPLQCDTGSKNSISELMIALREHSGPQPQNQPVRNTDGQSVTEQHAPKSSVSSHIKFIEDGSFSNQKEPKQSELPDLATRPASGRLISFEAGSVQSESELRPASGHRPKESVSSLNRAFDKGSVRDEGESSLVSEQQYRPKGSVSSRIRCFEQGAMHAKVATGLASQSPEPWKGRVSSRIKFFEQGAVCKKDGPELSEKHDLPKGVVSARINAFEANLARQLEERSGQNGKRKPVATNSRYSICDEIKALKESSTRELEDSRPTVERNSRHLSVQEQVDQLSKTWSSAGGVILLNEGALGDDGEVNNYSKPKIDTSNQE